MVLYKLHLTMFELYNFFHQIGTNIHLQLETAVCKMLSYLPNPMFNRFRGQWRCNWMLLMFHLHPVAASTKDGDRALGQGTVGKFSGEFVSKRHVDSLAGYYAN